MPPEIDLILHSTYKLSTWGGLPLEEIGHTDNVDPIFRQKENTYPVYLKTSAIKSVCVSPEIFEMPKDLTRAKSLREVISGAGSREESVDAQELFDTGKSKPR